MIKLTCDICEAVDEYKHVNEYQEALQTLQQTYPAFPFVMANVARRNKTVCKACFSKLAEKLETHLKEQDKKARAIADDFLGPIPTIITPAEAGVDPADVNNPEGVAANVIKAAQEQAAKK
jgi:hypothetical protein